MLLNATQQATTESVRAFAQKRIRPRAHEFERAGAYPKELFCELAELGLMGMIASETAEQVCSGALQTLGGYGYLEEFEVAKIYRDVRVCQIYEGTSDIQRMVIARAL